MDIRARNLRIRYGITVETYDAILEAQHGVCALCGKSPTKQRLHVDHDHETDRVRGLLCYSCNVSLGQLGDTLDALKRVVTYLEG